VQAHPSLQKEREEGRDGRGPRSNQLRKETNMTLQTIPLSRLEASAANPRRKIDPKAIEGLAASIRTDGLLQNLVVSPIEGERRTKRYRVVSGGRRFAALRLLQERGELHKDYSVPVEVREELSKDEALRIATVENLQRLNLPPLDEAAALTKLLRKGVRLDDLVSQTGLSASTIKRRMALNGLCAETRQALRKGEISLAQAEALTLGGEDMQLRILESIARGEEYSAETIKRLLLDDRPTVALAIFPIERYTGTVTTDLFADSETSYFDDAEQFLALQTEAVTELVKHHEASAAWVDLTQTHSAPDWQYRKAGKREKKGVLINLSPGGRVEIREGLARRKVDQATAREIADSPVIAAKRKAEYGRALCQYIAHHKTAALAELLLAHPRKAQETMVARVLAGLRLHPAFAALAKAAEPQSAYRVLEAVAGQFAEKLGLEGEDGCSVWTRFQPFRRGDVAFYDSVKILSDEDLNRLQTLLTALSFGQENCDALDTGESLFNRVAVDLAIDMRRHWCPDEAYFAKRSRAQLVAIARECGFANGNGSFAVYKKSELVTGFSRFFQNARAAAEPTGPQSKAREWLPGCMLFPAAGVSPADEDEAEEDESGAETD
jgi:ParB family chromosome partitioning protein